jgi:uncharacterized protein
MVENTLKNCTNQQCQYILVVAQSARMLVYAARQAGLKPIAIDLYGDADTRRDAMAVRRISSLAQAYLWPALNALMADYPLTHAVYGSGFEHHPQPLHAICERMLVLGNQADVFAKVQDKAVFFPVLERFSIPYPEVSFVRPDCPKNWLLKPLQGQGGVGIRRFLGDESQGSFNYWQQYQAGTPHSVLFLADGTGSQIVGFNRQWTVSLDETGEFVLSGIINSTDLSVSEKDQISAWLAKLVPAFSLKGLNSLDFIQHEQTSYVLEINPRPSASMQLYDADLFARHIKACQGELLANVPTQSGCAAYQIVYAQQQIRIPDRFNWPEHAVDIPGAGSIIGKGQPICSMIVRGKAPDKVLEQLQLSQELIVNQLNRFQTHGIRTECK